MFQCQARHNNQLNELFRIVFSLRRKEFECNCGIHVQEEILEFWNTTSKLCAYIYIYTYVHTIYIYIYLNNSMYNSIYTYLHKLYIQNHIDAIKYMQLLAVAHTGCLQSIVFLHTHQLHQLSGGTISQLLGVNSSPENDRIHPLRP